MEHPAAFQRLQLRRARVSRDDAGVGYDFGAAQASPTGKGRHDLSADAAYRTVVGNIDTEANVDVRNQCAATDAFDIAAHANTVDGAHDGVGVVRRPGDATLAARPSAIVCSRAIAIVGADWSIRTTGPVGPTKSATMRATWPRPVPRSRTHIPG